MPSHLIREINEADASWIFEACQDKEIIYWNTIPRPYTLQHAQGFIRGAVPEYKIWVIENKDLKPVGVISIHSVDEDGNAEIGYWIAPWGRGNGATKDAIALVENYAKSDPKIKFVQACISDLNTISQKVAQQAGLVKAEPACKTCPAGDEQSASTFFRKAI
ncbi:MAG: GNAT family N-acetyltransferase [Candidatus Nanopelagicus sp.]